jgi:hypothetical protein
MFAVALLALVGSSSAQVLSATGACDFAAALSWSGGVVPTISGATTIDISTSAQVSVLAAVSLATKSLTLGAQGVANTSLIISGVSFAVLDVTWRNGHIAMSGAANFQSWGTVTLEAAAGSDRRIVGGVFELNALVGGGVTISGDSLVVAGASLDSKGKSWAISSGASLSFTGTGNTLVSAVTFTGAGAVTFGGQVTASAAVTVDTVATVAAGASLAVAASGSLTIQKALTVSGTLSQTATGAITVSAPSVTFSGSAAAATNTAFNLATGSELVFSSGSDTTLTGSVAVTGTGVVRAVGLVRLDGSWNCGSNFTIESGGDFRIKAGVLATFQRIKFQTGAKATFAVSTAASAKATVTGAVELAGSIVVNVASEPAAVVVLLTATGGFSGTATFTVAASAGVGRRLLAAGTVVQNGNDIEYHPGTANGASSSGLCFLGLGVLSVLMW